MDKNVNKKTYNRNVIFIVMAVTAISVLFLYIGKWMVSCGCDRWLSTNGFWQALLANIQVGIGESFLGAVGCMFLKTIRVMKLNTKKGFRFFLAGTIVVGILGIYALKPISKMVDGLWGTGFWNSCFTVHIYVALFVTFAGTMMDAVAEISKNALFYENKK